jgi:hypothetical protein
MASVYVTNLVNSAALISLKSENPGLGSAMGAGFTSLGFEWTLFARYLNAVTWRRKT